jgi:hypothetical protein
MPVVAPHHIAATGRATHSGLRVVWAMLAARGGPAGAVREERLVLGGQADQHVKRRWARPPDEAFDLGGGRRDESEGGDERAHSEYRQLPRVP